MSDINLICCPLECHYSVTLYNYESIAFHESVFSKTFKFLHTDNDILFPAAL